MRVRIYKVQWVDIECPKPFHKLLSPEREKRIQEWAQQTGLLETSEERQEKFVALKLHGLASLKDLAKAAKQTLDRIHKGHLRAPACLRQLVQLGILFGAPLEDDKVSFLK